MILISELFLNFSKLVADVTHSLTDTTFNLDQSELRHFSRPLIGQWKQLATVDYSGLFIIFLVETSIYSMVDLSA